MGLSGPIIIPPTPAPVEFEDSSFECDSDLEADLQL